MTLKHILLICCLCTNLTSTAQAKAPIDLPEGGDEVSLYSAINLYVPKTQEVSTDGATFRYFDDISNSIINQQDLSTIQTVALYADEETRFDFIQKVKEQVAMVKKNMLLVADSSETSLKGYKVWLNSFRNISKDPNDILTLEQVLYNEKMNSGPLSMMPPPMPPPAMWYHIAESDIYSGEKDAIDRTLNTYSFAVVRLEKENQLFHQGAKLGREELSKLMASHELLFLVFSEGLLYKDYIHAIGEIQKTDRELRSGKQASAFLIEISEELEERIKDLGISLIPEN